MNFAQKLEIQELARKQGVTPISLGRKAIALFLADQNLKQQKTPTA